MSPRRSKPVLAPVLFFMALGLTGCATGGYWVNRGRDAADVFTVVGGVGGGAGARIGPLCHGLLFQSNYIGLEGGRFFRGFNGDADLLDATNGSMGLFLISGGEFVRNDDLAKERKKDLEAWYLLGIASPSWECSPAKYNASFFTQMEVVAGLGGTLKVGFNPGELFDFILGWCTLDIYRDDIQVELVRPEKVHLSTRPKAAPE